MGGKRVALCDKGRDLYRLMASAETAWVEAAGTVVELGGRRCIVCVRELHTLPDLGRVAETRAAFRQYVEAKGGSAARSTAMPRALVNGKLIDLAAKPSAHARLILASAQSVAAPRVARTTAYDGRHLLDREAILDREARKRAADKDRAGTPMPVLDELPDGAFAREITGDAVRVSALVSAEGRARRVQMTVGTVLVLPTSDAVVEAEPRQRRTTLDVLGRLRAQAGTLLGVYEVVRRR